LKKLVGLPTLKSDESKFDRHPNPKRVGPNGPKR
jgi:hypothetical protein